MPKDLPYFRWFTARAKADEKYTSMPDRELGFYHRCLNHAWDNDGLPADMDSLARAMKCSRRYLDSVWKIVGACWYQDGDRLRNKTQEEERERAISKGEQNSTNSAHGQDDGPGFIYLISRPEDGATKIGSSINVPRRLAQLRYKYRASLTLIAQYQVPNMMASEVSLHSRYSSSRVSGEWFSLSEKDLADIRITLGGDSNYHPGGDRPPRAYDSDSVSVSQLKIPEKQKTPIEFPSRFLEWIEGYHGRKADQDSACRAWISVNADAEADAAFACRDRYNASREVAEGKCMEASNFIFQQARNGWRGDWPKARDSPAPRALSVTEQARATWEARHARPGN